MKYSRTFLSLSVALIVVSCQSSKDKKEAELKSKEFFSLLKQGNEKKLEVLYPGFENFDTYYKSDSAKINYTIVRNGVITVSVHNRFTNGFGKISERDISLVFRRDSTNQLKIIDSKDLAGLDEKDEYTFGINTGCIDKNNDTTDQQILKGLKKAKAVMLDKAIDVYIDLKSQIKVVSWEWESGYAGSASGKGIVRNNSTFSVPNLKYKIIYKNSSGEQITSEDGYVTSDAIDAGESKSFTFYTSYVGNATTASISLTFDDDLIFKYLAKKEWTGNECSDYYKKNPSKLKDL